MLFPSAQKIGLLVLGALCAFTAAYDISSQLPLQGPLGVALDRDFALAWPPPGNGNPTDNSVRRGWLFSSYLEFQNNVAEILDAQLWKIARDAADEMEDGVQAYGIADNDIPAAMTVLAWGKRMILVSSQKGVASFAYRIPHTPVSRILQECQMTWRDMSPQHQDTTHRAQAKCGEIMAAQLYYLTDNTPLSDHRPRIATWTWSADGWAQRDPCTSWVSTLL